MTSDLNHLPAAEIARLIRARQVSARDVVSAHIAAIERTHAELNAVVVPLFEQALVAATSADAAAARGEWTGALHGVPVTVKETYDIAGVPSTEGVARWADVPAREDSAVVRTLRSAGAIVVGKTNLSQAGWFNESDNPLFGRTNNPWATERSPGGSSGGEAAAVAARISPLGFGTDSGGSIRHPAHCCGVAALKPTAGRLSVAGTAEERLFAGQEGIVNQPGVIARTVEDVALGLRVLCDAPGKGTTSLLPPVSLGVPGEVGIASLRVGFFVDDGLVTPAPAIRRAVLLAATILEGRGAHVEPISVPDAAGAFRLYSAFFTCDGGASIRRFLGDSALDRRVVQGLAAIRAEVGDQGSSADHYLQLVAERDAYRMRFIRALDLAGLDALVCPADALPAPTHGSSGGLGESQSYAALFNLVGCPAGVVPVTQVAPGEEFDPQLQRTEALRGVEIGSAGLPIGVQVVARHWREDVALALMAELETASGAGTPLR